jgi:hypothetical protein
MYRKGKDIRKKRNQIFKLPICVVAFGEKFPTAEF